MSSYSELIKNFEKVRSYMREFYVYGFKSRDEYNKKSARSYDDERRRMESWLGDHMSFVRTPEGKNVFISIDSRVSQHNPFYKALKAKSFTDGDITLHFILFDILYSPEVVLSLPEILEKIDEYLNGFENPMVFDESTVRKKLKEYIEQGIVVGQKEGRKMLYRRAEDIQLPDTTDVLNFYSEVAPCGVIGSFLLDKQEEENDSFSFKHHYITSAMDSNVLAMLFKAMREKSIITVSNMSRRSEEPRKNRIIPLRIFISVQNGRQHLLAYQPDFNAIRSFRIDYLSDVKIEEPTPRFDELRAELDEMQTKMWGVTAKRNRYGEERTEHVEFTVKVADNEEHIVRRLEREKRIGHIEKLDDHTYASLIRMHVKPYLGDKPVAFITTADVQRMYNKIKKGGRQEAHPLRGHELADSTVRSVHMMLHEAMDAAVKERLIVKNPTDGTTIPKNNYAPKQILTEAQLEKFMRIAMQDEVWRDFFYTELTTGLRLGEICGLRWSDFDEATGHLKISRTVKKKKGGGVTWGDTKTETGTRTILLPPSTADLLRERKKTAVSEWIFPNIYRPEDAMHPEYPYNRMKTLLKQAELPLIRFHDLRHTFATHALTGGVDAKTLSRILGHTNASFTLDTYTHVTTDMQKRASNIVGGFMEDLIIKE